jgi:hypothetical protein
MDAFQKSELPAPVASQFSYEKHLKTSARQRKPLTFL